MLYLSQTTKTEIVGVNRNCWCGAKQRVSLINDIRISCGNIYIFHSHAFTTDAYTNVSHKLSFSCLFEV